jgi:TolB-like protein
MLKKLTLLMASSVFATSVFANNHYRGYAPADYTVFSPNQYANLENRYSQFSKNPDVYYSTTESVSASAQVNELSRFLMDQLIQNREIKNVQDSRVAVTSFVMLDDLNQSNKFGVLLGEHMIHQLHVRGFRVVDFKSMGAIEVGEKSDHLITRDVSKLKNELNIHYALAGTISQQGSGLVINARLVDLNDQTVVSTAQGIITQRTHQILNGELSVLPPNVNRYVIHQPYPVHDNKILLRQR